MATYTDNYNLKKPTYAEPANVKDINDNMEIIDDVMHSTQISLADAYDLNSTYNTGDIVMYEMLMYKCKEDNVTGAWNASKWERTTAGESGGGADLDIYGEASGTAEASFSDGAEASLVKCIVEIEATQSGSGTPSPSNIRPISGHTDVTVTVASTSGGSGEDTTVSLGRTVYGGTLDVTTGLLTVDKSIVDMGNLNWTYTSTYQRFGVDISDIKPAEANNTPLEGLISSAYATGTANNTGNSTYNGYIGVTTIGRLYARNEDYTVEATFKTAMAGQKIVYPLATPQTFNLTPTQVKTLLGQNYVSHDGGGTISLVYVKGDAPIKPNPAGAEIPLTGLEINGEKFKIESSVTKNVLYTNTGSSNPETITLDDDYTNYDILSFRFFRNADSIPDNSVYVTIDTQMLEINQTISFMGWASSNEFVLYKLTDSRTLTRIMNGSNFLIKKVAGIKF